MNTPKIKLGRTVIFLLLAVMAALRAQAQPWARERLEASPRHLEWKTVQHDGREVACYVGYPEVKDRSTAVVVIHDVWGMSDWARGIVDDLAAAGYIAVAPDLLWGSGPKGGGTAEFLTSEIPLAIRALPPDRITSDLAAAVDYAARLPACNGKVVVVGFCWGGSESFRFATNTSAIKAAFVFYGDGPSAAEELAHITCPVIAFYAENDARINATVPETKRQMQALGKTFAPIFYEGAGHGFMKAGQAPAPAPDAGEDVRHRYQFNRQARDAAWKRLLEYLGKV